MTRSELQQIIPKDQRRLNVYRKKILRGKQLREVAWRSIWPFYKGTYSSERTMSIRIFLLLFLYLFLCYTLFYFTNNEKTVAIIFICFCVVRCVLTMLGSNSVIKKNEQCLKELSEQYTEIRNEYIKDLFFEKQIARYPSGYECTYNPRMKIYGQPNGTARTEFKLGQDYGEVSIYCIAANFELPEEAKTDAKQDLTKYIGSTEFKKMYQVRANDQTKCMTFLSPTMQVAFNRNMDLMRKIKPVQVRNDIVMAETTDCLLDHDICNSLIFEFGRDDTIEEHFKSIDNFVNTLMLLTKLDFLNKEM